MPIQKNAARTFRFRMVDSTGAGKAGTPTVVLSTGTATAVTLDSSVMTSNSDLGVGCWRIALTAAQCNADDAAFVANLNGAVDWYQPVYFEGDYTTARAGYLDVLGNFGSNVANAVWSAALTGYTVLGSFGAFLQSRLDFAVGTRLAATGYTAPPTAAQIATQVEMQIMDDTDGRAVEQALVDKINAADPNLGTLTLSAIGQAARDAPLAGAAVGSQGAAIAAIQTATGRIPASPALAGEAAAAVVGLATDAHVLAVKARTDLIPAQPAAVGSAMALAPGQDVRNVTGALTSAERLAIADAVASELLTPNDGQQVINAIVNAIESAPWNIGGLTTATIAAAVKALLEGSGSFLSLIKAKTDLVQLDGSGFVKAVEQHPLTDYQQRGVAVTLPTVAPATWRVVLAATQPDFAPAKPSDVSPTIQFSPTINPPGVTVNPTLTGAQATTIANLDALIESSGAGGHERFKATALEQAPAGGGGGGYTSDDRARDAQVAAEVGALGALPITLPTLNGAGGEIVVRKGTARTILRGDPLAMFEIAQDLGGAVMELHDASDGIVSTTAPTPPASPGGPWLVRFECGVDAFVHRGKRAYWVAARWNADGAEFALHDRLSGTIAVL